MAPVPQFPKVLSMLRLLILSHKSVGHETHFLTVFQPVFAPVRRSESRYGIWENAICRTEVIYPAVEYFA